MAPTSSVVVSNQDTAVTLAPVSAGMLGNSGTMTVCMMAWNTAPTARIGKTNRDEPPWRASLSERVTAGDDNRFVRGKRMRKGEPMRAPSANSLPVVNNCSPL